MVGFYRLKDFGARLESGAHIIPSADFSVLETASQIVAAAEARARAIVEEAKEVYEREKQRGYETGLAEAKAEALCRLVEEERRLDEGLRQIEADIAQLVEGCVRKLVYGFEAGARAEALTRQALATMRRERRAELRVCPKLFAFFRARIEDIRADYPEIELIDVVEDEALAGDQVIVESSIGRVDADLGRRLEDLRSVLIPRAAPQASEIRISAEPETLERRDFLDGEDDEPPQEAALDLNDPDDEADEDE